MPFDFLVAPLRCPGCGEAVDVEIQTHLQGGCADGSALGIGTEIDGVFLEPDHILGSGYTLVQPVRPGEPVRLLDVWSCPACRTEQWALVEIAGGRIERVEGVTLDRAMLGSVHYVSDINADILADSPHRRPGCLSSGWYRSRAQLRSSTSCSRTKASRS